MCRLNRPASDRPSTASSTAQRQRVRTRSNRKPRTYESRHHAARDPEARSRPLDRFRVGRHWLCPCVLPVGQGVRRRACLRQRHRDRDAVARTLSVLALPWGDDDSLRSRSTAFRLDEEERSSASAGLLFTTQYTEVLRQRRRRLWRLSTTVLNTGYEESGALPLVTKVSYLSRDRPEGRVTLRTARGRRPNRRLRASRLGSSVDALAW